MTGRSGARAARAWWAVAALILATLLIANRDLVRGRAGPIFDAWNQSCPNYMLLADSIRGGEVLLWDPWTSGGSPIGVDQYGAFSPLTLGLAWLTGPSVAGFNAYWLVVWAVGGLGVLPLTRHLGGPPWAAGLAAIGWMFSGVFVGQAHLYTIICSMAFLPWIIWRLDAAIVGRNWRAAAQSGALWGFSALNGYPGLTIFTAAYVALWGAGRLACEPPAGGEGGPARRLRGLGHLAVSLLAFVAVGSVAYAPTALGFLAEMRGYSTRSGPLPRATAVEMNALHPFSVATMASPHVVQLKFDRFSERWAQRRSGKPADPRPYWDYTDPSTCSLYVTPSVLLLAVLAPWLAPRDRFRWFLWGLGLFCLAAAMSRALPVRGWLYDLLPPMRYFRHASVLRDYFLFTLVALAPMACRDLGELPLPRSRAGWRALALLGAVGAALAAAALAASCVDAGQTRPLKRVFIHLAIAWPGVACVAAVGWLGRDGLARRAAPALLVGLAALDAALTVDLSQHHMFTRDQELLGRLGREHSGGLDLSARGLGRSFGFAGNEGLNEQVVTKEPTLFGYSPMANPFHRRMEEPSVLGRSALGADRVWFSPVASEVEWTEGRFAQLLEASEEQGRPCLFVSDPDTIAGGPPAATGPGPAPTAARTLPVRLLAYRPRELALEVDCPEAGWLLVTDRWTPGWRALVNGVPQKPWIGNFIFRAVRVGRGPNRVEFSYHPFGYPWLLAASWGTLALVALHAAWVDVGARPAAARPAAG